MEFVRELRRKQHELKAGRQALIDQVAKIDGDIAAVDPVIRMYEPDHRSPIRRTRPSRFSPAGLLLSSLKSRVAIQASSSVVAEASPGRCWSDAVTNGSPGGTVLIVSNVARI